MSTNYDDPIFDELGKDDRLGAHDWYVIEVRHDTWPSSGDPRTKIVGSILDAAADQGGGKPKADLTISPLPTIKMIKDESAQWSRSKRLAIANARNIYKQLAELYHKSPDEMPPDGLTAIEQGDVFRVHIEKNREGFCRVVAFKAPGEGTKATGAAMSEVPF